VSNLTVTPTDIPDVILLTLRRFRDDRGWLAETYSTRAVVPAFVDIAFVQDNQAFSAARRTPRGLHLQRPPQPQAKLTRVLRGTIFDAIVLSGTLPEGVKVV
jgi:dTDP-4-dehydrorhamnose 3,5-epimerase